MHIVFYLSLSIFFVACDSNINSFNIDVAGKVDYIKNTTPNTSTNNVNTGNNNNTGSDTNTDTGNNTNTGTNTNTGNNTNNSGTSDIRANVGTQTGTRNAAEATAGTGFPPVGGENITVEEYAQYFVFEYSRDLTKVKYGDSISSVATEGVAIGKVAKIPSSFTFIRIYFVDDAGDPASKFFEIATNPLPGS